MPELPDLQVFSRNLSKIFNGKTLTDIKVPHLKKLNVTVKDLEKAIVGQKVESILRVGKELHVLFDNGQVLGLHLMLHGKFYVFKDKHEQKFPIIELFFNDGTGLVLTDHQGAATPTLNPPENNTPDALDFDLSYLEKKLSATRSPVKTLLLNQKVLRGIGNAYADEILWHARISPFSPSKKIPVDKIKVLAKSIKKVLVDAEIQIKKTHPDIISGEFRDFMEVHNPKKKITSTGATIWQKPLGARKTYFTDEQELFD